MIGTMILVLTGCGSVVFAGNMPGTVSTGAGALEVVMAFGLSVVALAYVFGRNIRMSYKSGDHAGGVLLGKNALLLPSPLFDTLTTKIKKDVKK